MNWMNRLVRAKDWQAEARTVVEAAHLDAELLSALDNGLALAGGNVVCDFCDTSRFERAGPNARQRGHKASSPAAYFLLCIKSISNSLTFETWN